MCDNNDIYVSFGRKDDMALCGRHMCCGELTLCLLVRGCTVCKRNQWIFGMGIGYSDAVLGVLTVWRWCWYWWVWWLQWY